MHRIVVDTNTLISAIGWKGKPRKVLDLCIDNKLKLVETPDLIDEFITVIYRSKFYFIPIETKLEIITSILNVSDIIEPKIQLDIIKEDKKDNKVLECALAGDVDFIISGDKHLLKLMEYGDIKIMNASKFLKEYLSK